MAEHNVTTEAVVPSAEGQDSVVKDASEGEDALQVTRGPGGEAKCLPTQFTEFVYESDFDTNGVIYYLGSRGTGSFENPMENGENVIVSVSSEYSTKYKLSKLVSRDKSGYMSTGPDPGWMQIDLGERRAMRVTCYTVRAGSARSCFMRNWQLLGSMDGESWDVVAEHVDDGRLCYHDGKPEDYGWETASWHSEPESDAKLHKGEPGAHHFTPSKDNFYRFWRIYSTGPCSNNYRRLEVCGMEFYGTLGED